MSWIQTSVPDSTELYIENDEKIATSQDIINQIQAIYDGEDVWEWSCWPVTGQYYELIEQARKKVSITLEQLKR
jgi:hypothetical protein